MKNKKYFTLLLHFLFGYVTAFAQTAGYMTHYQRKANTKSENLPKPSDSFDATFWFLPVDRELFDEGKASVKKITVSDKYHLSMYSEFKKNHYTELTYTAKGKKNKAALEEWTKKLPENQYKVLVGLEKKRKLILKLTK